MPTNSLPALLASVQELRDALVSAQKAYDARYKSGLTESEIEKVSIRMSKLGKVLEEIDDMLFVSQKRYALLEALYERLRDPRQSPWPDTRAQRDWLDVLDEVLAAFRDDSKPFEKKLIGKLGSPPTRLQTKIIMALDGRALKKSELAKACGVDTVRLYTINRERKSGGLTELQEKGIVLHKHGIGYYRPDAPP